MVTFASLLVNLFILLLIIGIDMFLFKTTPIGSFYSLFTSMGLGKEFLVTAAIVSFLSAVIIDFRKKKA